VNHSGTPAPSLPRIAGRIAPQAIGIDGEKLEAGIDTAFARAMEDRQLSGGVCLVLRRGHVVFEKAYGHRSVVGTTEAATLDTIYDLASLTKPVATASAVMKLVEQGKLRARDTVKTHIAEWKNSPEEAEQSSEVARLKRYLRAGALRPGGQLFEVTDSLTTVAPGGAPLRESPMTLWDKMVSDGRVRLSDKAGEDLLQFPPTDRESITLRHLLTHTSGLEPFERYYLRWPERTARGKIMADIVTRKLAVAPGERFIYSDLGFITLAEIVERVSGQSLAEFTRREIFEPLGMRDTMFNPPAELRDRIAPTEWKEHSHGGAQRTMLRGEVHDGNAWIQDGISGHAGLFSTAGDLAIFCQMLLNGGEVGDVRIFSPVTVAAMTRDQAQLNSGELRGLGWDISTSYSGQRGDLFATGYGHTGWTGTSLWLVPEEQIAIIILTNRVHPDGSGDAGPLRGKVANVVAGSILGQRE